MLLWFHYIFNKFCQMLLTFWQMAIVPFWGILVFGKKVLPFSGVQPAPGSDAACPFLGHSCFQNKCFAVFRGCNRRQWGRGMSLFRAFLFLEKRFCRFQGVQPAPMGQRHVPKWANHLFWKQECSFSGHATEDFGQKRPKMAQNCINIYAHVPFWAILILNLNGLLFLGHAILCAFS